MVDAWRMLLGLVDGQLVAYDVNTCRKIAELPETKGALLLSVHPTSQRVVVVTKKKQLLTYAYQGGGMELDQTLIESIEVATIKAFQPDHTLLLDLDVELGLARAAQAGAKDRFESESVAFFERVRRAYLERANQFERVHVITAAPALSEVTEQVRAWINQIIRKAKQ